MTTVQSRMAVPDTALLALLGSRDESLRTAEDLLDADVHVRGNELTLSGAPADVAFAERVFGELIALAQRGQHVGTDTVRRTVEMLTDEGTAGRMGESPAEVHHFPEADHATVTFPEIDLAAVGRGYGFEAVTVRAPGDLKGVADWVAGPRTAPLLVHAPIASDGGSWWLAEAFRGH